MTGEQLLQVECVSWFDSHYEILKTMLFHPENERKLPMAVKYRKDGSMVKYPVGGLLRKQMGVRKGVPDLILLYPKGGYGCLCVEMKYSKGKQEPEQKDFQAYCELFGNKYVVCKSLNEFKKAVNDYLLDDAKQDAFDGDCYMEGLQKNTKK